MSDPDPREAHREEIFEALIDATLDQDPESFNAFNREWERIEVEPTNGRDSIIRFQGESHLEQVDFTCGHCHLRFQTTAMVFGEAPAGLDIAIHVAGCSEEASCLCWSEHESGDDSIFAEPLCQGCERRASLCECNDGPIYGPCAIYERAERHLK